MRWLKHMVATRRDERITRLIAQYGYESYGHYWAVTETVAELMDGTERCSVRYPVTSWSHLLSVRGSHVRSTLAKLEVTGLVTVEWNGSDVTVTIPNLLKYRDEYSRKSGPSPDTVGSKKQKQKQNPEPELRSVPPQAAELAGRLRARILENDPGAKITEHQLASWADEARLMIERDHRDPSQIGLVIDWAMSFGARTFCRWRSCAKNSINCG
ncbi:MAG TPA: hypothetical protein VGX94_12715 [Terriglobia bacterium]|nr:hypothetical protein [Terriglobia bacterium]